MPFGNILFDADSFDNGNVITRSRTSISSRNWCMELRNNKRVLKKRHLSESDACIKRKKEKSIRKTKITVKNENEKNAINTELNIKVPRLRMNRDVPATVVTKVENVNKNDIIRPSKKKNTNGLDYTPRLITRSRSLETLISNDYSDLLDVKIDTFNRSNSLGELNSKNLHLNKDMIDTPFEECHLDLIDISEFKNLFPADKEFPMDLNNVPDDVCDTVDFKYYYHLDHNYVKTDKYFDNKPNEKCRIENEKCKKTKVLPNRNRRLSNSKKEMYDYYSLLKFQQSPIKNNNIIKQKNKSTCSNKRQHRQIMLSTACETIKLEHIFENIYEQGLLIVETNSINLMRVSSNIDKTVDDNIPVFLTNAMNSLRETVLIDPEDVWSLNDLNNC